MPAPKKQQPQQPAPQPLPASEPKPNPNVEPPAFVWVNKGYYPGKPNPGRVGEPGKPRPEKR